MHQKRISECSRAWPPSWSVIRRNETTIKNCENVIVHLVGNMLSIAFTLHVHPQTVQLLGHCTYRGMVADEDCMPDQTFEVRVCLRQLIEVFRRHWRRTRDKTS